MIRIIVADDHAIIRQGLKDVFRQCRDLRVIGQASHSKEIFELLSRKPADVLVLDLSLPNEHGIDVLEELRRRRDQIAALVYTMHAEQQFGLSALKAGAKGYLTKDRPLQELILAVRKVAAGENYITDSLAQKLARCVNNPAAELPHEQLSIRERQVLRMIAAGKRGKEIAHTLGLSSKTTATYRARGLRKMRMITDAQVIEYFLRIDL